MSELMTPVPPFGTVGGGGPPEHGVKSLKQLCPAGQLLLVLQELPQPPFAVAQLEPHRVVLLEVGGGTTGGGTTGGGTTGGGVPPQAGKSLKHCWPAGHWSLLEQLFPQFLLAASQLDPQRVEPPEAGGGAPQQFPLRHPAPQ